MGLKKLHWVNHLSQGLKALLAIILLLFYLIGSTPVALFHQFLHAGENVVAHAPAQEKDPCHRAVYHPGLSNSCHHQSHVVSGVKCDLCHLLIHSDQIVVSISSTAFHGHESVFNEPVIAVHPLGILTYLPARAPPVTA